jgi:hypothetical protein
MGLGIFVIMAERTPFIGINLVVHFHDIPDICAVFFQIRIMAVIVKGGVFFCRRSAPPGAVRVVGIFTPRIIFMGADCFMFSMAAAVASAVVRMVFCFAVLFFFHFASSWSKINIK